MGLRTISTVDETRSDDTSGPLPVAVWVWYPTQTPGDAFPLSLSDLFTLEFGPDERGWLFEEPVEFGADSTALEGLLARDTGAYWDASPVGGPMPLVIAVQGVGHPAFVNEGTNAFLASHGYIVAVTSFGWPGAGLGPLGNQVRDIEFTIEVVSRHVTQFDGEHVGPHGAQRRRPGGACGRRQKQRGRRSRASRSRNPREERSGTGEGGAGVGTRPPNSYTARAVTVGAPMNHEDLA